MTENIKLDLNNLRIDQLGFVFKDIEKQAKVFESLFNIPKFSFIPAFPNKVNYRGKEVIVTAKYGFSRTFNTQIELIQNIDGESIYKEFLDQGKEGLNHISCFVDNLQEYIDQFKNLGYNTIYSGKIGKQSWTYIDTEKDIGFLLELQETTRKRGK